jgi:RNA polymerase sigma-70 factor (ECF subfamily)
MPGSSVYAYVVTPAVDLIGQRGSLTIEQAGVDRDRRHEVISAAYVEHYRSIFGYVLAFTRSPTEAEDVVAQTFEHALRAASLPDPLTRAWLLLTARHIVTDRWRRARRFAVAIAQLAQAEPRHSEADLEFWLWFDALSKALTDRQREVLVLRYQRDLTDEEIGEVMGLSPSGVRSLVARALDILRLHPELLP